MAGRALPGATRKTCCLHICQECNRGRGAKRALNLCLCVVQVVRLLVCALPAAAPDTPPPTDAALLPHASECAMPSCCIRPHPFPRLPLVQAELAAELGLGGEMAFTVRGGAPLSMTQAQVGPLAAWQCVSLIQHIC